MRQYNNKEFTKEQIEEAVNKTKSMIGGSNYKRVYEILKRKGSH